MNRRALVRLALPALVGALLLCQAACVPLLLPDFPTTIESSIERKQIRSLEPGTSSRADLITRIGAPQWVSEDDLKWRYDMRRYHPWGVDLCFGGGTGYYGWIECFDNFRELRIEILEVIFDESGIITELDTPSFGLEECRDFDGCSFLIHRTRDFKSTDLWLMEHSNFDLVELDGLLYEPGTSIPFTGTRLARYSNGNEATGATFEMGLRHGPAKIWYDDGSVYQTMIYEIGSLQGRVNRWYGKDQGNGRLSVSHYDQGKLHGDARVWGADGTLLSSPCYRNGELTPKTNGNCIG